MKKIISFILVITCSLIFVGCGMSTSNNIQAMTNIDQTLTKITSTIKKLDTISNDKLIMQDFMSASSLVNNKNSNYDIYRYYNPNQTSDNNGYNGATFTNSTPMTAYINKLQNLSNVATITISANNQLNYLKDNILSHSSYIKTSCNQIKEKGCEISNGQKNAINDLCNNLVVNLNRINLTKNEITNEINSLTHLKNNYTNNIDQLNSRYTRLLNCLETRTLYYKNILTSMNSVDCILNEICCPQDGYCYGKNYENTTTSKTKNKTFKSNIDTYENANTKNINKNNIKNTVNNYPQNPYYYNNYQQMPYRNFNNYNYYGYPHSPYSNYNPYMPNVDTFINYNNVDTFKSNKQLEKEQNQATNNNDKKQNENKESVVQTSKTKPVAKKYYTIAEEDYLKYKEYVKNTEKSTK